MKKIRLSIIGAGNISKYHLKVITTFKDVEVTSIFSRTQKKSKDLADEFKIKKIYTSIKDMIKNENPNGIYILVSADQIYKVIKEILIYKIPFFVEKPPGISFNQFKKLSELSENLKIKNMVGFNRRFYSIFAKGLKILKKKGKINYVSIYANERTWLHKNDKFFFDNIIILNSIHTLDLIDFLVGKLDSYTIQKDNNKLKKSINLKVNFISKQSTLGTYYINNISPYFWSIKLFGKGVTVVFDNFNEGYWIDKNFKKNQIKPNVKDLNFKAGFYDQFKAFKMLITKGKLEWPAVNLYKCYNTMKIASKISNEYKKINL